MEIEMGQVWRRRSDGRLFTVERVDDVRIGNRRLTIKGFRRSTLLVAAFRRQYDFVGHQDPQSPDSGSTEEKR